MIHINTEHNNTHTDNKTLSHDVITNTQHINTTNIYTISSEKIYYNTIDLCIDWIHRTKYDYMLKYLGLNIKLSCELKKWIHFFIKLESKSSYYITLVDTNIFDTDKLKNNKFIYTYKYDCTYPSSVTENNQYHNKDEKNYNSTIFMFDKELTSLKYDHINYKKLHKLIGFKCGIPIQFIYSIPINLWNIKLYTYDVVDKMINVISNNRCLMIFFNKIVIPISNELREFTWQYDGKIYYNKNLCGLYDYTSNYKPSNKTLKFDKVFENYSIKLKYLFSNPINGSPYIKLPCKKYFISPEARNVFKYKVMNSNHRYDIINRDPNLKEKKYFELLIGNTSFYIPI